MPADGPEPDFRGEIAYRLGNIDERLAHLVGRAEYDADQRHADTRFVAIEEDVKEIKDVVKTIGDRDDDRRRWMISTFVAPLIMAVLVVALMNALKL